MKNQQKRFSMGRTRAALSTAIWMMAGGFVLSSAQVAHAQLEDKLQTQFDLFVGKNTTGPYILSWNNILVNKEVPFDVMVDGQTLPPQSYTVDTVKGVVTFTRVLSDKSVARIAYSFDKNVATRNANAVSAPLAVPVSQFGQTTLSLITVPNSSISEKESTSPLILGLGGKTKLFGGSLTSDFKASGSDKTGTRLGFAEGNDRNGLDVQFARVNKEFATTYGSALGMADATQRLALATRLAPSKYFRTNYSQSETTNLLTNEHKDLDIYGLGIGGVGTQPSLNFSRTADNTIAPDKTETNITTDKLDLAARLDKMTSVKASSVESNTDAVDPNVTGVAKGNSLTLTSSANGGAKQATATVSTADKDLKTAKEKDMGVSVRLQPAPIFIVSAAQNEQKATGLNLDGTTASVTKTFTQTAGAEITPMPGTKVTSSLMETTSNAVKTSATSFGAQVGTGKKVEISTGVTNRSSEAIGKGPLDTTMTRVALRPLNNLTVTGGYTWNPEDNGIVRQALRQEVGLATKFGAVEFGSNYTLTTLNGLTTNQLSGPQFGLVSLSLGLQFSRYTRLTGTYKDSLGYRSLTVVDPTLFPQYMRSYSFGLTHNLGSSLNFAVGGSLNEDRSQVNVPAAVKGEAKLGIHF